MSISFLLLCVIVLIAFTTEAMAGFGSVLIAVTLGSHLRPVTEIVTIAVPLNLMISTYLVARHRRHVDLRLLLITILPLMGGGLLLGQLVFHSLAGRSLEVGLGCLVVVVSIAELRKLLYAGKRSGASTPLPATQRMIWLLGAGVLHGIYATGGPPLVYAIGRSDYAKNEFRATLSAVWLVLNIGLAISFTITGTFTSAHFTEVGLLAPLVLLSIICGELLHSRINEHRFRIVVFAILLLGGASLLF